MNVVPISPIAELLDERLGSWQPIDTAVTSGRVDLWFTIFEHHGDIAEGCWWNADAEIPDWYRTGKSGEPEVAIPPSGHASHWKKPGDAEGPIEDGGPGLGARIVFDSGVKESWPQDMQARWARYDRANR